MPRSKSSQVRAVTPAFIGSKATSDNQQKSHGPTTGLVVAHRAEPQTVIPTAAQRSTDGGEGFQQQNPVTSGTSSSQVRLVFWNALQVVLMVVRNALGCLLCAWATNFCYSLGNLFSLRKSENQSSESLIVANTVWTSVFVCTLLLLTHTTMLLPNRFLSDPDKKPSALVCMKKLVRRTYRYYIISIVLMVTWAEVVAYLLPASVRWLRLNFYGGSILIHVYSTGIDMATRTIFSEETCQGEARRAKLLAASDDATAVAATTLSPSVSTLRLLRPQQRPPQLRRRRRRSFWRIFFQTFPKVLIAIFAGAYVQIASRSDLFNYARAIVVFAVVSYVVKFTIQEIAKEYAMRHNIKKIRFLCILVGVPTVLIDTQVRIVLLSVQGARFAAVGSLMMAIAEILMRAGKMALLKLEIRQQQQAVERQTSAMTIASSRSSASSRPHRNRIHPVSTLHRMMTVSGHAVASQASFERWKKQRVAFHTAEVIADMYAEYIAIGCSASILYFFSGHPKYQYGEQSLAPSGSTHGFASSSQLVSLALQFGLEVMIDFLACAFEIASGAKFESVRKLSAYLAFMFMTIAVVNIGISSFLYLK